ncbi:ABC transporter permease [Haloarchaeobius amylolyticus]|uniref:ABC transporter permease n=1 Tax=Haloarchaeobius amylolyticus TaxID=1198296 RepID=UPI002270BC7E|nr:ABC transporter permease [Haloarchaeobius amylolyticus]
MSSETATGGQTIAPGNGWLGDVWVNFKRWNLKAVRNPFVLTVSTIQPAVFLILFSEVFGGVAGAALSGLPGDISYVSYLTPAIVMQVALIAAATSGIGLVEDIEDGMFEKTLVSPMRRSAVFVGKTLSEMLRIAVQICIVLGLGSLLGAEVATGIPGALAIIGVGIVFSIWFASFSNVIAIKTKNSEATIIAANILQFPLLFLSTAFLPKQALPEWVQTFAELNPITYGVEAAREIMLFGWDTGVILESLAVLVALDLALGAVAIYVLTKASSSKVQ